MMVIMLKLSFTKCVHIVTVDFDQGINGSLRIHASVPMKYKFLRIRNILLKYKILRIRNMLLKFFRQGMIHV